MGETRALGFCALCAIALISIGPGEIEAAVTPLHPAPVTCPQPSGGTAYDVGPGFAATQLRDIDWQNLKQGDVVRIHVKPGGYHEKLMLRTVGTPTQPLTVCGIPDASGNLPVLDGANATTRSDFDFPAPYKGSDLQDYALVYVYNHQYTPRPANIQIMGLQLQGAKSGASYTTTSGVVRQYIEGAACLRVQGVDGLLLQGNRIVDCDNGLLVISQPPEPTIVRGFVMQGNAVYGHGVVGSYYEHNAYIQAIDTLYEGNFFGAVRSGAEGSTLKDRAASTTARYNYFDCSARCFDMVEPQEHWPWVNEAAYRQWAADAGLPIDPVELQSVQAAEHLYTSVPTQIYGNVFVNYGSYGSSAMIHYGADNLGEDARAAPFYFFNNTLSIIANLTVADGVSGIYFTGVLDRNGNGVNTSTNAPQANVTFYVFNNLLQSRAETPSGTPSYIKLTRTAVQSEMTAVLSNNRLDTGMSDPSAGGRAESALLVNYAASHFDAGQPVNELSGFPSAALYATAAPPKGVSGAGTIGWQIAPESGVAGLAPRSAQFVGARDPWADPIFANGFEVPPAGP